jgi:flagellar biosynthesis protein FliQ
MKGILKDIVRCLKLSLKIFLVPLVLGVVVGLIASIVRGEFYIQEIFSFVNRMTIRISCFGLAIAAIGMVKTRMMEPLNYEEKWAQYFSVLNLVGAIFFISLFMLIYSVIIDVALFKIY